MRRRKRPDFITIDSRQEPSFDGQRWVDKLRESLDDALDGNRHHDEGRELRRKARRALSALTSSMGEHPSLRDHEGRPYLVLLSLALDALDYGSCHPMLRKVPGANRPPETKLSRNFRLIVLQFCEELIAAGIPRDEAYGWLASELTKAGAVGRNRTEFPAGTIKRWYQRTLAHPEKDKGAEREDDAQWLCWRSLGCEPSSAEEVKLWVRNSLQTPLIRALLPKSA